MRASRLFFSLKHQFNSKRTARICQSRIGQGADEQATMPTSLWWQNALPVPDSPQITPLCFSFVLVGRLSNVRDVGLECDGRGGAYDVRTCPRAGRGSQREGRRDQSKARAHAPHSASATRLGSWRWDAARIRLSRDPGSRWADELLKQRTKPLGSVRTGLPGRNAHSMNLQPAWVRRPRSRWMT
jgi:hypothetical protein